MESEDIIHIRSKDIEWKWLNQYNLLRLVVSTVTFEHVFIISKIFKLILLAGFLIYVN